MTAAERPVSLPPGRPPEPAEPSPHERLVALGLQPVGGQGEFDSRILPLMLGTPIFAGLESREAARLADVMQVYDAASGLSLITEGEPGDFMALLLDGTVDVLRRDRNGAPSRLAVARSGSALGEMSMFDGEPRFASCLTIEPCRIAVLTRKAMMDVMQADPALGNKVLLRLVRLLSERLRQTGERLVALAESSR